ncbi:MAG: acyl-CoA/acyl-ACP dehydrogenase [Myxococcales bacterium]|nr:acyl-CoA/acyl-ACP dehydrogenase [Myxococcales bacterium]
MIDALGDSLAKQVEQDGRLSRTKLDAIQPAAFQYAYLLAELEAARAGLRYAANRGAYEQALAETYTAMVMRRLLQRVGMREAEFGWEGDAYVTLQPHRAWIESTLSTERLVQLGDSLLARDAEWSGAYGVSEDHEEVRKVFARFADEKVAPLAEHIHRHDDIIPESLLQEYAAMGVFGISIPDEYDGSFVDNLTMCLATEELSRASLGAGGSVITRPEICAKAILKGGSDEQKRKWLPSIAQGETLVSVAVTEPNAGSDVANVRVSAKRVEGGYVINGEKTWCTFAGRANVFILLARTGDANSGHKGLTLFLVEKPAKISDTDHHHFAYKQSTGGTCEGRAIPTLGYRGMHSFSVSFEDYFVPEANRLGDEGQGFVLQMEGFAGGRIQTAARAVGVMEAALREGIRYAQDRQVFGKPLAQQSLTRVKLVEMAATLMVGRQLSYHVAELMDEGKGSMEASLVKLMTCREAEQLTREAMQLHGGMGYSEEYPVSRYWTDARVLSIFEGAEEVLALYVVARQAIAQRLAS